MKDFKEVLQKHCEKTGDHFMEYSPSLLIIKLLLPEKRTHEVHAYIVTRDGKEIVEFMSKVCDLEQQKLNLKDILMFNQEKCCYSKFIIFGGMLQVAASAHYEESGEKQLIAMLNEVGQVADEMEAEITGQDVF